MKDYNNNGAKVDQCPDTPSGQKVEADGCNHDEEKRNNKIIAGGVAVGAGILGAAASGAAFHPIILPIIPLSAGLLFGESVMVTMSGNAWDSANDPPDTIDYERMFTMKIPSSFWSETIKRFELDMQEFLNSAYLSASAVEAFTKSMEKYEGAKQVGDYKAAFMQARAVRFYAKQASQHLNEFADSTIKLSANDPMKGISVDEQKKAFFELREKLLKDGVTALPNIELKLAETEGWQDSLQKSYEMLLDENTANKFKSTKLYYLELADISRRWARSFDILSKTFGANIWVKSSQSADGATSVSAYYKDAPNNVSKFAIEILKPNNVRLVKINKGDAIREWELIPYDAAPNKITIIGFSKIADNWLVVGTSDHLFEIQFKPKPRLIFFIGRQNYGIGEIYLDMYGWLSMAHCPSTQQPLIIKLFWILTCPQFTN